MAVFKADEASNYGGQGGGGFFSIAEDKGVKSVRFLYNSVDDVNAVSVHKVQVGDKDRYVDCLRTYRDPIDDCPFCRAQKKTEVKLFIPVYNIDEDQVQIWDRGKKMIEKMTSICSRYASKNDLVQHTFEIERHGKPKDTATTYEIYETDCDDTKLTDFEVPNIVGGLVLSKSYEDMEHYIRTGSFPDDEGGEEELPRRRGRQEDTSHSERAERRVPRRGDAY